MQNTSSTSKGKSHPAVRADDGRHNNPGRPSTQGSKSNSSSTSGSSNKGGRPKGS